MSPYAHAEAWVLKVGSLKDEQEQCDELPIMFADFAQHTTAAMANSAIVTTPVLLLILLAALDSADKALLGASFPILEKEMGMDVEDLGYFSLFTNLSYALSLPFWGWLIHRFTLAHAHSILGRHIHIAPHFVSLGGANFLFFLCKHLRAFCGVLRFCKLLGSHPRCRRVFFGRSMAVPLPRFCQCRR